MTPDCWRDLLGTWSREIVAVEEYRQQLPPEVVTSGWLGYPPASLEEIAVTEARLDMILPPSYRAFLKVTNGWRMTTSFIERSRPVGEIGWYRDEDVEGIVAWRQGEQQPLERNGPMNDETPIADALEEVLAISDGTHSEQIYLLNPGVIGPDGEWEAWFFAAWVPGAETYPSFWDLMQAEHESFLALLQD